MTRTAKLLAAAGLAVLALIVIVNNGASTTQPRGARPAPNAATTQTRSPRYPSRHHASSGPGRYHTPSVRNRGFRLVIHTAASLIDVPVAPLSVASHQPVDPPHNTAREWDTAAWIVQSTYPTRPNQGTAYIYGHACEDYICAFNDLKDVRVGDTAKITTRSGAVAYRVARVGLGAKTANSLPDWASDSTVPNRIVLVTCSYQPDGESVYNLLVIAHLVHLAAGIKRG